MEEQNQSSSPGSAPEQGAPAPLEIEPLTRRMSAGDEAAWRMFYDAYFDRLWRYLIVVADGNEDFARESLQGALVRVARHIKVFPDEKIFWGWLTVLARTAYADEAKKRRRYFSFLERFVRHKETEEQGGDIADDKLDSLLKQHVGELPADEQELIEQKYSRSKSVREIAAELQMSEKAVESKLSRIRRKLKEAALKDLKNEK